MTPWAQPIAPIHSVGLSALVATLPLVTVLGLLGIARKSGLVAAGRVVHSAACLSAARDRGHVNRRRSFPSPFTRSRHRE